MRVWISLFAAAMSVMLLSRDPSPSKSLFFETVTINGVSINSRIVSVFQDSYGFVWFGTDYGLFRFDGYRTEPIKSSDIENTNLLSIAGIEALVSGGDSSIWIGTNLGLFNINLQNWKIERPEQFRNHVIRALLNQGDSILWVGTTQGLFKYPHLFKKVMILQ